MERQRFGPDHGQYLRGFRRMGGLTLDNQSFGLPSEPDLTLRE
jgi:hypothetical protein